MHGDSKIKLPTFLSPSAERASCYQIHNLLPLLNRVQSRDVTHNIDPCTNVLSYALRMELTVNDI
jgi:hypothetical protein